MCRHDRYIPPGWKRHTAEVGAAERYGSSTAPCPGLSVTRESSQRCGQALPELQGAPCRLSNTALRCVPALPIKTFFENCRQVIRLKHPGYQTEESYLFAAHRFMETLLSGFSEMLLIFRYEDQL